MKDPWTWTEEDLQRLIETQTEESISLDYKACAALEKTDKKKTEISKDVSALANSAGGTLVYGVLEDKHLPTSLDRGYDPKELTKEWLEQVINSNIQRRIDGIRINPVLLNRTSPGRVAYVVYVPQSTRAAHQAADRRFYKRFNFESVPMEEYEIRDVARRLEAPDLSLQVVPHLAGAFSSGDRRLVPLAIALSNESDQPAEHVVVEFFIDERLVVEHPGSFQETYSTAEGNASVGFLQMHGYRILWSAASGLPIFKGIAIGVSPSPLRIDLSASGEGRFLLAWRLHSPRMAIKEGYDLLEYNGNGWQFDFPNVTRESIYADPKLPWRKSMRPTATIDP